METADYFWVDNPPRFFPLRTSPDRRCDWSIPVVNVLVVDGLSDPGQRTYGVLIKPQPSFGEGLGPPLERGCRWLSLAHDADVLGAVRFERGPIPYPPAIDQDGQSSVLRRGRARSSQRGA